MYSEKVTKIIDLAKELAADCVDVSIAHVMKAIINEERPLFAQANVDITALESSIDMICDNYTKIPAEKLERYKKASLERKVRLSYEVQSLLNNASRVSESCDWQTGWVELSHLLICTFQNPICCKDFTKYFTGTNSKYGKFVIDKLVEEEAANRNISMTSAPTGEDFDKFTKNLVEVAKTDDKPFIGRKKELSSLMQCLERRDKPNAILVGAPGVGKTDVVRGLALKIAANDVPEQLKGASLYSIDISAMVAGSELRGSFEKRLKNTIEAACQMTRPILFIDEIHTVLGAGRGDSSMDAANILKPYLTDGKIRVIGSTTDDEFRKYVENDAAFMRRFQKISVNEPSNKEAIEILTGVKSSYESFHKLSVSKEAIKQAVELSVRHMHDRFLPDKAIDLIDQTCARVKLHQGKRIVATDIEESVSELCHISIQTLQSDEMSKIRGLDKRLKNEVFGQEEAIDKIVEHVQLAKTGLNDETKPIGSFLFVGPSGVGKTEIAKQLSKNLGINFIRFDMSEYAEPHTISKLIGSPAGYVGYDDGGILVESVRKNPNSVILFDEIEKAHPDIYKIFLQILDYGMLSDNKGRKADFRNTIIIMTSNAGNSVAEKPKLGFGLKSETDRKSESLKAVSELMPPELRGRISSTVIFNSLTEPVSKLIVKKELSVLTAKLKAKKVNVKYSDAAIAEIASRGISAQYGAREIQKVINKDIKALFVKLIMNGASGHYLVDIKNNEFSVKKVVETQNA